MELSSIKSIYFLGAGGIGMSALVRYFLSLGKNVGGYDRTQTKLTQELINEGANIHYSDSVELIDPIFKNKKETLVVYTPAIPNTNSEYLFFKNAGYDLHKRSEVLGLITKTLKGLCVAGTHGKTTTSTLLAHILYNSSIGCNAFLGGISHNYNTNLLLDKKSPYAVIEADEFDRSFHRLYPYISIITSADPDHLDIYGDAQSYKESFEYYTSLIAANGVLIIKKGVELKLRTNPKTKVYTYSMDSGDFHAENIKIGNGEIHFDFIGPDSKISDINLGVPLKVNIENSIAAIAVALICGVSIDEIKKAVESFKGIERRFDFILKQDNRVLISDYAHHPTEIEKSIESVKELYPNKKLTVVFQPHLYSRTKDFYKDFAKSLSLASQCILLDIYPAREEPIEGVSSRLIMDEISNGTEIFLSDKQNICNLIEELKPNVLLTLGAGDINLLLPEIKETLLKLSE